MVLIIKIVLFVGAGVISYRSTLIGLMLLLSLSCTFLFVAELSGIALPVGSIDVSEVIILVLFLKTVLGTSSNQTDKPFKLCVAMILWLSISSMLALFAGQIGLRETYRLIFKIALFWILPITVRELSLLQKKRLLSFSLILASIVSGIQLFGLLTENLELLSFLYPMDSWEVYGYASLEHHYADIYRTGVLPRLYIPGSLFIRMIFGFTLCLLATRRAKDHLYWLFLVSFLTGAFTLTLGGRSDFLFIVTVVVCCIGISFAIKETGETKKSPFIFVLSLILLVSSVIVIENYTDKPIVSQVMERWSERGSVSDEDERIYDTIEGWNHLVKSPIWGIGITKVHWEPVMLTYGGQDIHPFISQGLIGGFPAIIMLLYFVFILCKTLRIRLQNVSEKEDYYYALAAAPPLVGAFMLSAINTAPVFLYSVAQVPLGIFSGMLLYRGRC